jgi:hypothetical protein
MVLPLRRIVSFTTRPASNPPIIRHVARAVDLIVVDRQDDIRVRIPPLGGLARQHGMDYRTLRR